MRMLSARASYAGSRVRHPPSIPANVRAPILESMVATVSELDW